METKITQLNETIRAKVAELGLKFVDGPGPEAVDPVTHGDFGAAGPTNGQSRAVYGFAVAEAA